MNKKVRSIIVSGFLGSLTIGVFADTFKAIVADSSEGSRSARSSVVEDFIGLESLQQRLSSLNDATFDFAASTEHAQLVFELFDGLTATGQVSEVIHHDNNDMTIVGDINHQEGTTFIITRVGEACTGLFHFNDGSEVEFDSFSGDEPNTILLREINPSVRRSCGVDDSYQALRPPGNLDEASSRSARMFDPASLGGNTRVDVVAFVSQDTYEDLNQNMNTVRSRFRSAIALSNTRFSNSNIDLELEDVAYYVINLPTDNVGAGVLLDRFSARSVVLSKLEAEKADFAVLISSSQSMPQSAGIAYLYEPGFGKDDAVFAAVPVNQLNYALTHEFGHLFGCSHDRAASSGTPPFSYGYGFLNNQYATQMSYETHQQLLNYFSSPFLSYNGTVLGSVLTDNSRVIRTTMGTISNFRTPEIQSVKIVGPGTVVSGTSGTYRLKLTYDNGAISYQSENVTWGENSPLTTISEGVLTAGEVVSAQSVRVTASYLGYIGQIDVNLLPKQPVRLAIFGPHRISEGNSASYRAYIIYNNGTRKNYSRHCTWIDKSPYWVLPEPGRVRTSAVRVNSLEALGASLVLGGKTYRTEKNIVILDRNEAPSKPPRVRSRQTVNYLKGAKDSFKNYRFFAPKGTKRIIIKLFGGRGDADLKIRHGRPAQDNRYDYVSESEDNTETIIVNNPEKGYWYIGVEGSEAYARLRMKCEFRK